MLIIINTNRKNSDLLPIIEGQCSKLAVGFKTLYLTEQEAPIKPKNYIGYTKSIFSQQIKECLPSIKEEFFLFMCDDNIPYKEIQLSRINNLLNYMNIYSLDSIRLVTGDSSRELKLTDNLYLLPESDPNHFTLQPTIWRKSSFQKIFEQGIDGHIGGVDYENMFEIKGSYITRALNMQMAYWYEEEPKRGQAHYDSNIFPVIASALVKGKWNLSEYNKELTEILEQYKIDPSLRGVY